MRQLPPDCGFLQPTPEDMQQENTPQSLFVVIIFVVVEMLPQVEALLTPLELNGLSELFFCPIIVENGTLFRNPNFGLN